MNTLSKFRLSKWVAGSLFAIVAANFLLLLFVAGADVFLGQPPQFMVPLFALLFASGALTLNRRRRAHLESHVIDAADSVETSPLPIPRWRQSNAPAYVAMTIIRRSYVMASASGNDR